MDCKDARGGLESGGDARCRCNAQRRVLAALVIQVLLTAACAAASICVYLHQKPGRRDNGIYLEYNLTQMSRSDEDILKFTPHWNQTTVLMDGSKVMVKCGGPYILYLWVCVDSVDSDAAAETNLMMMHEETETLIQLQTKDCKQMERVVMLSQEHEVTFKVVSKDKDKSKIRIEKLHLGLHYMLGDQCFPKPPPPSKR